MTLSHPFRAELFFETLSSTPVAPQGSQAPLNLVADRRFLVRRESHLGARPARGVPVAILRLCGEHIEQAAKFI
jgi:hypothetical protein